MHPLKNEKSKNKRDFDKWKSNKQITNSEWKKGKNFIFLFALADSSNKINQ